LDGAVIRRLAHHRFAVSDASGQYTLKQLPPGPCWFSAPAGFLAVRGTMVNVAVGAGASSFTLRREGGPTRRA
jgi:hypothetical protein